MGGEGLEEAEEEGAGVVLEEGGEVVVGLRVVGVEDGEGGGEGGEGVVGEEE